MTRVLIVSDCALDKVFVKTLEDRLSAKVDIYFIDTTDERRKRRLARHATYMFMAVKAFLRSGGYDVIIFWQQFIGLYYAVISKCAFWKKRLPKAVVLQLIYNARKGFVGKIYKFCFGSMLRLNTIDRYICHSAHEQEFYRDEFNLPHTERVSIVNFGIGIPDREAAVSGPGTGQRYFFSGGTSNRDYKTLFEAFVGLSEVLKIACFPKDMKGLNVPQNVSVLYGVYRNDFLDFMKKAYAVIITLDDIRISSGQLVLLDAMRLGKAIIATKCDSMADYVDEKCAIFVRPHSSEDIRMAVEYLVKNKDIWNSISVETRIRYEHNFTIKNYAERVVDVVNQIR